jgi:hypothetical protein
VGLLSSVFRRAPKSAFQHDDWRRAFGSVVDDSASARMQRADEMFPVKAYRGLKEAPDDPKGWQWFTDRPEIANTYAHAEFSPSANIGTGANVVPARLNPGRALEVDAKGETYQSVPVNDLPEDVRKVLQLTPNLDRYGISTDRIAGAASAAGYDSVAFRNVRDAMHSNGTETPLSTVYAVLKPENVRSRFAQFDPDRRDVPEWLAGIGGLAVAGGAGGGMLSHARRRQGQNAVY